MTFIGERESGQAGDSDVVEMQLSLNKPTGKKISSFYRMNILEFDSNRKCMSVIVRDPRGHLRLLTKGAESSVLPKCIKGPIEETLRHVHDYALVGLRTLVVATKTLSEEDFKEYQTKLEEASQVQYCFYCKY